TRRVVEESPGESELRAQVFRQRLDPDRLRRVVPGIEDVHAQFFGIEERMVRPFARDVGVESRRSRLADHRNGPSGANTYTPHPLRAERQDARRGPERRGDLLLQW